MSDELPGKWARAKGLLFGLAGLSAFASLAYAKVLKPVTALILTVLWQVLVGVVAKVWERLEKTIVDLLFAPIDAFIRNPFAYSRYRKRYFEHLTHRYRHLDVKGLSVQSVYSLQVEQIYVDLTIDPGLPNRESADPIHKTVNPGRHSVWTFLSLPDLRTQNFAVIGAPGSGKTTLLKHVTLALAKGKGQSHELKYTPVLLFIRDVSESINATPSATLSDTIDESAKKMGIPAPPEFFKSQLKRGHCLIMLDGLDEVADEGLRSNVAKWVEGQMQNSGPNRFVITSRPFGYKSNPLAGVTVLEVRPFTLDQVRLFISRWYLANEKMAAGESGRSESEAVRIAAREGAEQLWERLQNKSALLELAINPLLLTMITTVHKYRGSLPGRRVELYAEICDAFLGKRQQARGMQIELTPAQKKRVLQPLAFKMMYSEIRHIKLEDAAQIITEPLSLVSPRMTCKEFLRLVEESSGLVLERENGLYGFAHLTFQEYLAAIHILEERLQDQLLTKVSVPWWHETIRLYVALGDGSKIIKACLATDVRSAKVLTLAIECVEEARTVEPNLREAVSTIVISGVEDPEDPERRHLAVEAILNRRVQQMVRLDEDKYMDRKLLSQAEYQYFIDLGLGSGYWRQPDHWKEEHFQPGKAAVPVLGIRQKDAVAFCSWLNERNSGEWQYQLPESGDCLADGGFWTSGGRVERVAHPTPDQTPSVRSLSNERLEADRNVLNKGKLRLLSMRDGDIWGQISRFKELSSLDRMLNLSNRVIDIDRDMDRIFTLDLDKNFSADRSRAMMLENQLSRNRDHRRALHLSNRIFYREDLEDFFDYFSPESREQREFLRQFKRVEKFGELIDQGKLAEPIKWARNLAAFLKQDRRLDQLVDFRRMFEGQLDAGPARERTPNLDRQLVRAAFRVLAMYLVVKLSRPQDPLLLSRSERRHLREHREKTGQLCSAFLDAYASLLVLEERCDGRFRPIEGIRLMRVMKPERARRLDAVA
jgi:NACHT domain